MKTHLAPQLITALALVGSLLPNSLSAEEGGTGHYMPGSMSSFMAPSTS